MKYKFDKNGKSIVNFHVKGYIKMEWMIGAKAVFYSAVVAFVGWVLTKNNFGPFKNQINDCQMTYMWRNLNFMDVGFRYGNRYSLILYGEGFYAMNFMHTKKVDGIPVLFVPGNAGSARQARSLGSVLQNKTELQNTKFHFDVFAVDFNEELSGLSSEYILNQADYLSKAVDHIWKMYDKPPNGIIFVGHSMGGIAIRLLISNTTFDVNKVSMVLTFATPHYKPPLPIDYKMVRIWSEIHDAWNTDRIKNSHIKIVSVSGGFKDELIDEIWTIDQNVTHVSTTGVDRVWLETDHQCIVWCNQLVRQTSRLLFEYARNPTNYFQKPQIYLDRHYKESGLRLKKFVSKKETVFIDPTICTPKCPSEGMLKIFVEESFSNKTLLVLSKLADDPEELVQVINATTSDESNCHPKTRFLSEENLYALISLQHCMGHELRVNLNKTQTWLLDNSEAYLPPLDLTWKAEITNIVKSLATIRFNIEHGVKVLNVSFYNNDLIVNANISLGSCVGDNSVNIYRSIWKTAYMSSKMDTMYLNKDNSLLLYFFFARNKTFMRAESEENENTGQIIFISLKNCTYEVGINIDYPKTLFRITRYYFSLILMYLFVYAFMDTTLLLFAAYLFGENRQTFTFKPFLIVIFREFTKYPLIVSWMGICLFILWTSVGLLVDSVVILFISFKKILPTQPLALQLLYGFTCVCLYSFTNFVHSFPPAILLCVINILHLHSFNDKRPRIVKNLSNYLVIVVLLQAVAGSVYLANVIKYREFISTSMDLNSWTVNILILFTFLRLFDLKHLYMHLFGTFILLFYIAHFYLYITSDNFLGGHEILAFDIACKVFAFFWMLLYFIFVLVFL